MSGRFIVECETLAFMADFNEARVEAVPFHRGDGNGLRLFRRAVNGRQRILSEEMLDIGNQEFLMLLFVVQSEQNDIELLIGQASGLIEQRAYRLIDMSTILTNLFERWPREQPTVGSRKLLANIVVIGVEEKFETRMKNRVVRVDSLEHEGLKEPCRMGEMPFRGTGVGH